MVYRVLSWFFFLAALGCGTAAAVGFYWSLDKPGVVIEQQNRDKLEVKAKLTSPLNFRIHNPTWHNVRVVGYRFC